MSSDVQEAAAVVGVMDKQADPKALKVCIMTADFWGLKSAGGTATAYHLLAAVLAKSKALHVSVPVTLPGNLFADCTHSPRLSNASRLQSPRLLTLLELTQAEYQFHAPQQGSAACR